jgi:hypothetical protein
VDPPIEIHAAEWRPFVTQRAEISGLSAFRPIKVAIYTGCVEMAAPREDCQDSLPGLPAASLRPSPFLSLLTKDSNEAPKFAQIAAECAKCRRDQRHVNTSKILFVNWHPRFAPMR